MRRERKNLISFCENLYNVRNFFSYNCSKKELENTMDIFASLPRINFVSKMKTFFTISSILVVSSVLLLIFRGLKLGIDFTGGNLVQVKFPAPPKTERLRAVLAKNGIEVSHIQTFTGYNSALIRIRRERGGEDVGAKILKILESSGEFGSGVVLERNEYVGPAIGKFLIEKAMYAIVLSLLGIIVYVGIRFKGSIWGIAGVIALIHDLLITLGLFSIINHEVSLLVVTALLTLAGYSINDTIVVFDRIRENLRLRKAATLTEITNMSINETLSRTILTAGTTLVVTLVLLFLGGGVLHDFALALSFGIFTGTYSSIFIASPVVVWFEERRKVSKK
jgi:preprotein translocase subunit SecF